MIYRRIDGDIFFDCSFSSNSDRAKGGVCSDMFRLNDMNHVQFYFQAPLIEKIPEIETRIRELMASFVIEEGAQPRTSFEDTPRTPISTLAERNTRVAEYRAAPYELIRKTCPGFQDILDDLGKDFSDPARIDQKKGTTDSKVSAAVLARISLAGLTSIEELFKCVERGLVQTEPSEIKKEQGVTQLFVGDIPVALVKLPASKQGGDFGQIEAYARLIIRQRSDGTLVVTGEYLLG